MRNEVYEEQQTELRKRLEKLKETPITSKNFSEVKGNFFNIISMIEGFIGDNAGNYNTYAKRINQLLDDEELHGIPKDDPWIKIYTESKEMRELLKNDIKWRIFASDLILEYITMLERRIKQISDIEQDNIKLELQYKSILAEKERADDERKHEREMKKLEKEAEIEKARALRPEPPAPPTERVKIEGEKPIEAESIIKSKYKEQIPTDKEIKTNDLKKDDDKIILTETEKKVLKLMSDGKSITKISIEMGVRYGKIEDIKNKLLGLNIIKKEGGGIKTRWIVLKPELINDVQNSISNSETGAEQEESEPAVME